MNAYADLNLIRASAAAVREALGDDDDTQAFWDTLEGETDALEFADKLLAFAQEAAAMEDAIAAQIDQLRARKERMARRQSAAKANLLALLDATGEKKMERPIATVSRRAGSLSVHITDEAAIPTQLCKVVKTPDKTAIKAQLKAGETVPGATLERGPDGVTVRYS